MCPRGRLLNLVLSRFDIQIDFLEFRRDLEIVFYNIDQLDKPLFLEVATGYASTILAAIPTSQLHVNDVELALHIVWLVGSSKQNAVRCLDSS